MSSRSKQRKRKIPRPPVHGDANSFYRPDAGSLLEKFTDEEIAQYGLTREDLSDPAKCIEAVKVQATEDWLDREGSIEELVERGITAINMYPGDRHNALARFYGEQMADIQDTVLTAEDAENMLMSMMMAIFKLAENRLELHKALDGAHRHGSD